MHSAGVRSPWLFHPPSFLTSWQGVLLQTSKDIAIGLDVTPDDTLLQYTTVSSRV